MSNTRAYLMEKRPFPLPFLLFIALLALASIRPTNAISAPQAGTGNTVPKMYWVDLVVGRIQRANLDGSNVETVVSGLVNPDGMDIDAKRGHIYWVDRGTDKLQRANLDGSNIEDLIISGIPSANALRVDSENGHIYWSDGNFNVIQRANLDGTNVINLVSNVEADGIDIDLLRGHIYWTDPEIDEISRAKLDGTERQVLISTGLSAPQGIALDAKNAKMYWVERGTDKVQRANRDGSNIEDLVTSGLSSTRGITLDLINGKIYWTDSDTDKIQRANLDGSNVEDLVTNGQTGLRDIALDLIVCHPLDLTISGSGTIEASPNNSSGCPENEYLPGESVSLTASAAEGWQVKSWGGTDDDNSTASANILTMPDKDYEVAISFQKGTSSPPTNGNVYLPHISNLLLAESEDNDSSGTANPLLSDLSYFGYLDDGNDYFSVLLNTDNVIEVTFAPPSGLTPQLQLLDANLNILCFEFEPPYHIRTSASSGLYYIRIFQAANFNQTDTYTLRASYQGNHSSGGNCQRP